MNRENVNCEIARRMMETNDPGLAQHLRSCASCILRAHAPYYEAPAGLEQKIRKSLHQEITTSAPWRWIAIAASILLIASGTLNLLLFRSRVDPQQLIAKDVVSAHIRSLTGTHLLDVPSSDQHTVKPWFNGKLDFAPTVKEVEGFRLVGGRLEYLDGRPAAALVYARRNHVINLFTWPSATPAAESSKTFNGFPLDNWIQDGMAYWTVSDLSEQEFRQFVTSYRKN